MTARPENILIRSEVLLGLPEYEVTAWSKGPRKHAALGSISCSLTSRFNMHLRYQLFVGIERESNSVRYLFRAYSHLSLYSENAGK